ncbi:hypothetical protein AB0E69_02415 [Kribbella sp. NPDC026611]|uniref:hypothetical protein n=1 Tax=Kribbella sp. NPDC026611 TaxID=3154911 RepID=UPI0033D9A392
MTTTLPPPVQRPWSGVRTLLVIVGGVLGMVSLILFAIGGAGLWAQQQRDGNGYFSTGTEHVATSSSALLSPSLDINGVGPDAFYTDDFLGKVRIDIRSDDDTPVFVGIGPAAEVATYLNVVGHDEVTDLDVDPFKLSTTTRAGDRPAAAPAEQSFWVASGTESLDWTATGGDWAVVIMNADGSPNVDAELSLGATLPAVEGITIGALIGAVLLLIIAAALIVPAVANRPTRRPQARVT